MRTTTIGWAAALAAVSVLAACGAGSHQTTGAGRPATTGPTAAAAAAESVGGGSAGAAGGATGPAQQPTAATRPSTGTPPAGSGSTAAGTESAAASAPSRPTSAQAASGAAGGIGSAAPVMPPACALSALRVQALRGGASMGQEYALIMFTNDAATACRVSGYPSVSLRSAGATLGSAQPAQTSGSGSVMLRSGATAQVQVRVATECAAAQSDSVKVGVPQSDGYVTVPLQLRGCTLRVGAFQPAS